MTKYKGKAWYKGKRMVGSTPRHCMTDGKAEWHYPKAKDAMFLGAVIGAYYDSPHDEKGFSLPKLWCQKRVQGQDHRDAEEWQAEHRLALEIKKQGKAEASPHVKGHVDALRDAVKHMKPSERATFLAYLITTFTTYR